jgi:hypothetical protein
LLVGPTARPDGAVLLANRYAPRAFAGPALDVALAGSSIGRAAAPDGLPANGGIGTFKDMSAPGRPPSRCQCANRDGGVR